MAIRALRKLQLGLEATPGTAVPATALWRGKGTLDDQREVKFSEEDVGYVSGLDRTYVPKVLAALSMEDVEATFEQLPYILAAGVKNVVTGSADGGGSDKIYTYPFPTTAVNTIKTYTIEGGDDQAKEEVPYCFVEAFKLSGKAGEAVMMSADWLGRQASANRYAAATIAFVAATKKITDSANGLAAFLTGETVKVTGSPLDAGVYTIATGGVAAEIVTTEALVDEAASATVTLRDWFAGGPSGLAVPSVEEILFQKGKLYIDAVGGTLGATLKSNTFLGMDLSVKTGWIAVFAADGNLYFSFVKSTMPEITLDITFEHDGTSEVEKEYWRAQTARKLRMDFDGSAVTTPGTDFSTKKLRIDLAGKWEKFEKLDENDGNDIVKGTFRVRYNATAALFAEIKVVNELASLA